MNSGRYTDPLLIFPSHLDLIIDGMNWVAENFPVKEQVFVFDKDNTLISSQKDERVLHQQLIEHVVRPANQLNDCITVLYTVSSEDDLRRDLHQFPELAELFDFFITGDNFTEDLMIEFVKQGKLSGDPRKLEWERIYKPVSRIFSEMNAVLLDDCAGTIWSSVTIGVDGVKAYGIEEDSIKNAGKIYQQCLDILKKLVNKLENIFQCQILLFLYRSRRSFVY
jgi:hypothetical protein